MSTVLVVAGAAGLRAQAGACTYGLPSVASDAPSAGGRLAISLVTQPGCGWTATTASPVTEVTAVAPASGFGSATVQVTLAPNTAATPRAITITLGDPVVATRQFLINQLGTACSFTVTAPPALAPSAGVTASFRIGTQPNCGWTVSSPDRFISFAASTGVADASGSATIGYTVAANTGATDTRRSILTVTNPSRSVNPVSVQIAQSGGTVVTDPWKLGDLFAGIGSWWSDFGTYRSLSPDGTLKTPSDLHDAYGGTTTGCMIDPAIPRGDLWTTAWDGLQISRFSDATHQLVASLDLTAAGLATVQRSAATVPVPYTTNILAGSALPDITYNEQLVFDQRGNFFAGTSMYVTGGRGLGHAYLLKFAKNDDGAIAGCPAKSPCLLDWWRVDSGGELPAGRNPAGTNAQWTKQYKSAYASAAGDAAAKTAAALAAVAPLAASLSYLAGTPPQMPGPAGVDELDLSSDQHTVFYTSEDNRIRRFDTATSDQLSPLTISDPDTHQPYMGKAYGFRLLPDGQGSATGSAGLIVAMSIGVYRTDATGTALKPAGSNVVSYNVDPGVSHPFAMNLTPDAQSFWVATTQEDSSHPTVTGGKLYRFHIATGARVGPINIGLGGANLDIQGLCVKREFVAGVNQCFQTDKNGQGVLDVNGNPIVIPCRYPVTCRSIGVDTNGQPNPDCYPPGQVPLALADRSSFEGDRAGAGGAADLDLRPLTIGHRISSLVNLPAGLSPVTDPLTGDVVGVTGLVRYGICPKALIRLDLPSDPVTVCLSYPVVVNALDGASTTFTWNIHFRNAPPSIASQDWTVLASTAAVSLPTPASDPDIDDALIARASATAFDPATNTWVPVPSLAAIGLQLTSGRFFPSAGGSLAVVGRPTGYPLAAPLYPAVFAITIDLHDCNNALADAFTPATNLDAVCFHHVTTTFRLTVITNRPPDCSKAAPGQALWPPNHKFVPVAVNGVTDPDGDAVRITITSIWQDEPVSTQGSGNTVADGAGVGTSVASVRAERTGVKATPGDGRIYQINFRADDGKAGGTCTGAIYVGIPHDQGQMRMPVDSWRRYDSLTGVRIR